MASDSREMLSINCLHDLLNKIWEASSKWYNIGLGLELSINELDAIRQQEELLQDRFREMLKKWLRTVNPNKSQLIEALKQPSVGHQQLAEALHTWVPPATTAQADNHMAASVSTMTSTSKGAMGNTISNEGARSVELSDGEMQNLEYRIVKDIGGIREKFATLQTQICKSLKSKASARVVAAHIVACGVISQTCDVKLAFLRLDSLEEIFVILSDHWSFLDYDLLKSIVKNFGDEDEKSKIEEYQRELQLFCNRRVSEVPKEFLQKKRSEHKQHDKDLVVIKLKLDDPRLRTIIDIKSNLCDVMNIEPASLQIEDVRKGCVEIIFLIPKHMSDVFKKPLSKQQWEAFQAASVVSLDLSYGSVQIIFMKPNFEAMINYVHKELDHDQELLKSLISASNKQKFGKEVIPSGQDFLTKVQESGWISPVDPNPLYDLLEEINRHDIVHKAKLEALVHGEAMKFREETEEEPQSKEHMPETKAARLKKKGIKDQDIIKEYMKDLHEKKEEYFDLSSDIQLSKGENSDSEGDDDEIDSDYQSELASIVDGQDEDQITEEDEGACQYSEVCSSEVVTLINEASPKDSCFQSQSHYPPPPVEDQKWEVECTSQVLKKLTYRKTPQYLRKAICAAIINDIACHRHQIRVKTNNTEHQLYQRKVLRDKVTILWERAVQFSPNLTESASDESVYFTDVIRLWDIVIHERSLKKRIKAIEKAWNCEREAKPGHEKLKLCSDISQDQRVFKRILSGSGNSDFQVLPPADPDPNQYKPVTLYNVPGNIEFLVTSQREFELPIKMWPEEHEIIQMDPTEPIVVLGRSGTGKTTCCLYRMVQEFLNYYHEKQSESQSRIDSEGYYHEKHSESQSRTASEGYHPLRQLFVTKNKFLREKFEAQFNKLIAYHFFQNQERSDMKNLLCPVFLTWDDFLILMDHSLCDSNIVDDIDSSCDGAGDDHGCPLKHLGTKVTADHFINTIWQKIRKGKNLDPQLVWMEIKSFIKGFKPSGRLSLREYVKLSSRVAPNFAEPQERESIYEIYKQYMRHCGTQKRFNCPQLYDDCDLVSHLHQKLLNLKSYASSTDWLYDSLYVDEVQDFTQCEILLLIQSCKTTMHSIFLTGDTAQTVMRDVSFRFKDLKTSFFEEVMGKAPEIHDLTINYRSHSGILNLARHVLTLLEKHFPDSVDRVPSDNGMFPGPTPKFIKPCDLKTLKLIIAANVRDTTTSDHSFGAHQAIIVRTDNDVDKVPFDKDDIQILSIYEAKGLEYDDVLLYNFFSGYAEEKEVWKAAFLNLQTSTKTSASMSIELKHLYTAITRAKVNLWIYESQCFDEHSLPILAEWREGTNNVPLIDVIDPDSPNFIIEKSFATAKKSTPKQWKLQGDTLLRHNRWKQAAMCYRKAHRFDLEAEALQANPNLSRPEYQEIVIAYLKADELAHNAAHLVKVAENLLLTAKRPNEYLEIAWLYKSLKMKSDTIKAYKAGGYHMKVSELYEEYGEYPQSVQILIDAKLYLEAAAKAKKFEDSQPHKSFELSCNTIAEKYILRYCHPPEVINDTAEKMFYGLLRYIKDVKYQVLLLKHAKRFAEALENHLDSHDYVEYFRLTFAQGPNVVSNKLSSPNAITYYDRALQLSSKIGFYDVKSTLVIHSSRAYFCSQKSCCILKLTQLDDLSKAGNEINIRLNAILLLARFYSSRVEEAVEVCRQHQCLPGEVELLVHCFHELPTYCSFRDQLELVNKIQFLLSLEKDVLITQYKDILGLYEGNNDELYIRQKGYPADLKCTFEPDSYLLPHESQDIWLQEPYRLSQGKKIQDIDGMYVISPDVLFHKIIGHLKGNLRRVEESLAAFVSQSPLYKYHFSQHKHHCAQFDTEAASSCLEFCMLVLSGKVTKFHKSVAVELLRCYHSIETSHYFPICENYTSHINIIRGDAWRIFKSQTITRMKESISGRDTFDFLKLWEQSAITKNIPILKDSLERNEHTHTAELSKAALSWLDICQHVISNPLESCQIFFYKCLPQLIKHKQNLNSIVDAISIYGTITLMLISQGSGSSSIIPHMYTRSLLVYESLISKPWNRTISTACCNLIERNFKVLKAATKVLQQALTQTVSLLKKAATKTSQLDNLRLSHCLILILTLFANKITLQPTSSTISELHLQLNQSLELTQKSNCQFQFDCQVVCADIQHARHTSDFLRIIEYLLCPNTSTGRFEALVSIVRERRGLEMNILSDKDVRNLPSVAILGSDSIPRVLPIPKVVVSPLLPEEERGSKLSFQFHFNFQDSRYSLRKLTPDTCRPPWILIPEKCVDLEQILQSETPASDSEGKSLCQVCKVTIQSREDHIKSDNHAKNLALYKHFSMLHDTKYTRCESELEALKYKLAVQANDLLENNNKLIQNIYEKGQWENGIDLLLTFCIPTVKDMIQSLSRSCNSLY